MAKRANFEERLITPTSRAGLTPEVAASFNWGRGARRKSATDFYGVPDFTITSKMVVEGIDEFQNKLMALHLNITAMRPTHLRAAVKVEYQAKAEVPVAKGPDAYWYRKGGKPPAGGLRRSIRSFATDQFGEVAAGGGAGAQTTGGYTRSMTGEFVRPGAIGMRGQRIRTVGGKGFQTAKNLDLGKAQGKAAQYGAGKGNVPYAGPIHFGWNTRPNPSKKWIGGPIKPNPFLWRAYQRKLGEVVRVYDIDLKKLVRQVGL